jgi:hypothetical protein
VAVTAQANLAATNTALIGYLVATNTALASNISSVSNSLGSSQVISSNALWLAKQPASSTLSNLAVTGALTNILSSAQGTVFTTNNGTGVISISATNQTQLTNGFGDIVYSNHAAFATQAQLSGVTNGLVGPGITNGFATQAYVNTATNGFVTSSITNGFATQAYVNTATNGFINTNALATYAPTSYVGSAIAPLATTNQLNAFGVNGTNQSLLIGLNGTNESLLIGANGTNYGNLIGLNGTNESLLIGLNGTNQSLVVSNGVITYINQTNAGFLIAASNTAANLIGITNRATLYAITNAFGVEKYYGFLNTNLTITFQGFGSTPVNTIFFTAGLNLMASSTGIYYYYDGVNWDVYSPSGGILYQLGGLSPVGNTYTVVNGIGPAGTSYLTNAPVSVATQMVISNIAQNITVGGVVQGPATNEAFSSLGTNIIMSLAGTNGGGGTTNFLLGGVVGGYTTNNYFTLTATNIINSIAASYATNGAGATNVYIAPGAGIKVVTNTPSYWTISTVIYTGTTDPNGSVSAQKGSLYMRFDSNSNFLYSLVNTNGITGWQE